MRIEAYNQIQSLYQTQKVRQTQKANAVNRPSDQISISSFGKDMQVAKAALASTPDIREDITADIKKQIQNGTYSVSTESFADKLLAKYQQGLA
ncbi:MAG: flagellar biosynthesis anti-sigma factor FlgM [Lachnospiraceae bacterium]|nr:flagellar biosynthesis anti-sigma factor FlgM [Lachnospiraceae bacterium]